MIVSQHKELMSRLSAISKMSALTLEGCTYLHAELTEGQSTRLIEQCDEIIELYNKLRVNLVKVAAKHLQSFDEPDE